MNEKEKYLRDKYLKGETSLSEERELKNLVTDEGKDYDPWFNYLVNEEVKTPQNLSQELWKNSSIHKKSKSLRSKIFIGILSVFLLAIIAFVGISIQQKNEYEEKKQLLEEAIQFANNGIEAEKKDIFYKDDLITIYLTY